MDYESVYKNLILKAQSQTRSKKQSYCEQHHILPKCLNGPNSKENLVLLTAKEHFVAHHLLWKIYPENIKITKAFSMFVYGTGDERDTKIINVKEYERLKIACIAFNKASGKSSGKRMFLEKKGIHSLTKKQLIDFGYFTLNNKIGLFSQTKEQLSNLGLTYGKQGGLSNKNNKTGIFKHSNTKWSNLGGKVAGSTTEAINRLKINSAKGIEISTQINKEKALKNRKLMLVKNGFSENYKISREEAFKHGINFCYDKVCNKHPELNGLYYLDTKQNKARCSECRNEGKLRRKQTSISSSL